MRLKGKVCVITGGAQGMGAVACSLFAKEGAKIVAADLAEGPGQALAAQLKAGGAEAVFVKTDISREEDCAALMKAAVKTFGGIDVLYNNAGIFPPDDHSV